MRHPIEWHVLDGAPQIPTPTHAWARWTQRGGERRCYAVHPAHGNLCARAKGHTGRHASYGHAYVVAVWL